MSAITLVVALCGIVIGSILVEWHLNSTLGFLLGLIGVLAIGVVIIKGPHNTDQ